MTYIQKMFLSEKLEREGHLEGHRVSSTQNGLEVPLGIKNLQEFNLSWKNSNDQTIIANL